MTTYATAMKPLDCRILTGCRLCQGPIKLVLDLGMTPLANEYATSQDQQQDVFPLRMVGCQDCGHFQLDCVVDPKRMFREYAYQSGTTETFRKHLSDLAEICAYDLQPGDLVVDIASNDGTFLKQFVGTGVRVCGIEPAVNLATQANLDGVDTLCTFFTSDTPKSIENWFKVKKAKLITALNVMAHIDNIHDVLDGVKLLLAEDGRFILEVGYLPEVIRQELLGTVYHEHLDYWHLKPMMLLLEKHGLVVADAQLVASQGGSVRVTCQHAERPVGMTKTLYDLVEDEQLIYPAWLEGAIVDGKSALERVHDLKAEGKRICGYGAPAKLTTLCYALGIERDDLECILDDNPLKIGKFTPGKHIPIVSSSELAARAPDALVLFSRNFADEIKAKTCFKGEWICV